MRYKQLLIVFLLFLIVSCVEKTITEYRTPHQIELANIIIKYAKIHDSYEYKEVRQKVANKAETVIHAFAKRNDYRFNNLKGIVIDVKPFYGYFKFQIRYHIELKSPKGGKDEYSSIVYSHTYGENEPGFALTKGLAKGDTVIFSGRYLKYETGRIALGPYEATPEFAFANPDFSVDFTKVTKQ